MSVKILISCEELFSSFYMNNWLELRDNEGYDYFYSINYLSQDSTTGSS